MPVLAQFKNHSVKMDWQTKKKYLRMVWYFRTYPHMFVRMVMGIRLAPHQRIGLRVIWRIPNAILQWSRGMAKTFTEAVSIIALQILYKSYKIQSTAGGSFKQTEQTFDYASDIVKGEVLGQTEHHFVDKMLPKHGKVVTRQPSNWSMKIGSSLARGLAMKGNNRGFRANELTVGEANDIERDVMDKVLKPFMNVGYNPLAVMDDDREFVIPTMEDRRLKRNFLMLSGTISFDFTYYFSLIKEYIKRMMMGDTEYAVYFADFEDSYVGEQSIDPNISPKIKKSFYRMAIKEILAPLSEDNVSVESWMAEQKNVPIQSEGKFYPPILVFDSYKKKDGTDAMVCPKFHSDKLCVMGIDPMYGSAKGQKTQNKNAEFALTITEIHADTYQVVHCFGAKGIEYGDATYIILDYLQKFPNIVYIGMDARGGGIPIRDNLRSGRFGNIPIIDPLDPDNAAFIDPQNPKPCRQILRLLSPTDEFNTIENESLKNMLQMKTYLMPYTSHGTFDYERDNRIPQYDGKTEKEIENLYVNIHQMKMQMTCVETERTRNYLSFFVRSGQKDRYSSNLYAAAMCRQYALFNMSKPSDKPPAFAVWSK